MKPAANPHISIIVPVLNEEENIKTLHHHLKSQASAFKNVEILIVDGGSTDESREAAQENGLSVISSPKGRAIQMNRGAAMARAEILYFLHVDTLPPKRFDKRIRESVRSGYEAGCFRMRFDSASWFLRFFSWFSRINHPMCRGGDQSLFITKELFYRLGGFDESYTIYEDTEFISRIYRQGRFKIIPEYVVTSARKYEDKGALSLQYHFGVIHMKNWMGAGPNALYRYYKKNIGS